MKVASKPVVPILHQVSINWREANFQFSASPSHRQNGATGSRRRPTASHKPHPRSACFHALISPAHHNPLRFSKSEFAAEDVVSVSLDRLPNLCSTWKAIFTQESESLPVPLHGDSTCWWQSVNFANSTTCWCGLAGRSGFEPPTSRLTTGCSPGEPHVFKARGDKRLR